MVNMCDLEPVFYFWQDSQRCKDVPDSCRPSWTSFRKCLGQNLMASLAAGKHPFQPVTQAGTWNLKILWSLDPTWCWLATPNVKHTIECCWTQGKAGRILLELHATPKSKIELSSSWCWNVFEAVNILKVQAGNSDRCLPGSRHSLGKLTTPKDLEIEARIRVHVFTCYKLL